MASPSTLQSGRLSHETISQHLTSITPALNAGKECTITSNQTRKTNHLPLPTGTLQRAKQPCVCRWVVGWFSNRCHAFRETLSCSTGPSQQHTPIGTPLCKPPNYTERRNNTTTGDHVRVTHTGQGIRGVNKLIHMYNNKCVILPENPKKSIHSQNPRLWFKNPN